MGPFVRRSLPVLGLVMSGLLVPSGAPIEDGSRALGNASEPVSSAVSAGPTPALVAAATAVADRAGAAVGGTYWDAARRQMVVRVTTRTGALGDADRPEAGVRIEPAPYPLADLQALAGALTARRLPDVVETYVDVRAGRVTVAAAPGRGATVDAAIHDRRVVVREAPAEPVRAAGGSPLVGGGAACTMGFTGTRRGVPVFLTAGHCGREGTTFTSDGRSAGRVTDVVFPESDYAVGVFEGSGPRGVVATGPLATAPVRGSLAAPVGTRVCSMGSSSGWACGTIVATGVTVRYGSGAATQYVRGLTKVDVCRSGGDSGGPWLWGTQAQGLTSGGAGTHGAGCVGASGEQAAYLQPINPVLDATGVVLDTAEP